jgi:hypothetical protein
MIEKLERNIWIDWAKLLKGRDHNRYRNTGYVQ